MSKPYLIGITGGSGSGKTFFLDCLLNRVDKGKVCVVSQDNYYKDLEEQPIDENGIRNFDTPGSIHFDQFAADLLKLKNGQAVKRHEYTFNDPQAVPKTLTFQPAPIIIVEGLFVMYDEEIDDLLDLRLFIDTKEHLKLKRRIIRDQVERGYDLEDVLYRFEKHVMPSFEKYIRPLKYDSDIIIPNNRMFDNALDVIISFVHEKTRDRL